MNVGKFAVSVVLWILLWSLGLVVGWYFAFEPLFVVAQLFLIFGGIVFGMIGVLIWAAWVID